MKDRAQVTATHTTTAIYFQELHPTTPDSDSAKQYKNHP